MPRICVNLLHTANVSQAHIPSSLDCTLDHLLASVLQAMSEPAALFPPRTEAANRRPLRLPGRRILVVDDDADTAQSLALILREEGYTVDTAGSAEDAIERFRHESYHL